jgi:hypothetical protein
MSTTELPIKLLVENVDDLDFCQNRYCGQRIETQVFKHTGRCSILCEKVIKGELSPDEAKVIRVSGRK